ncbi:MAG: twin-arginine translocation signal domain-containing protein, partial [Planctomycetes bacterium]|nr:twin-arginine translocation signal domain-containing protein [Planctomycetota bacterium]
MNRRNFLKVTGLGAASLVLPMPLLTAQEQKDRILDEVDTRIEKYRMGSVVLSLLGPNGKSLKNGSTIRINQKRHKFLFGCNIFKLNKCRTADDNAAYAERFAALLNFATLPFYWWNYERQRGKPDDVRTE